MGYFSWAIVICLVCGWLFLWPKLAQQRKNVFFNLQPKLQPLELLPMAEKMEGAPGGLHCCTGGMGLEPHLPPTLDPPLPLIPYVTIHDNRLRMRVGTNDVSIPLIP